MNCRQSVEGARLQFRQSEVLFWAELLADHLSECTYEFRIAMGLSFCPQGGMLGDDCVFLKVGVIGHEVNGERAPGPKHSVHIKRIGVVILSQELPAFCNLLRPLFDDLLVYPSSSEKGLQPLQILQICAWHVQADRLADVEHKHHHTADVQTVQAVEEVDKER